MYNVFLHFDGNLFCLHRIYFFPHFAHFNLYSNLYTYIYITEFLNVNVILCTRIPKKVFSSFSFSFKNCISKSNHILVQYVLVTIYSFLCSGERAVPHVLHDDLHAQRRPRHAATQPRQGGGSLPTRRQRPTYGRRPPGGATAAAPHPGAQPRAGHARQRHRQVQPRHLPHHVPQLPPDVLDDLPEHLGRHPREPGLPSGVERSSLSFPLDGQ